MERETLENTKRSMILLRWTIQAVTKTIRGLKLSRDPPWSGLISLGAQNKLRKKLILNLRQKKRNLLQLKKGDTIMAISRANTAKNSLLRTQEVMMKSLVKLRMMSFSTIEQIQREKTKITSQTHSGLSQPTQCPLWRKVSIHLTKVSRISLKLPKFSI